MLGREIVKYCTVKAGLKCSTSHYLLCIQTMVCADRPKVKEVIWPRLPVKVKGYPTLYASCFEHTVGLGLVNIFLHVH